MNIVKLKVKSLRLRNLIQYSISDIRLHIRKDLKSTKKLAVFFKQTIIYQKMNGQCYLLINAKFRFLNKDLNEEVCIMIYIYYLCIMILANILNKKFTFFGVNFNRLVKFTTDIVQSRIVFPANETIREKNVAKCEMRKFRENFVKTMSFIAVTINCNNFKHFLILYFSRNFRFFRENEAKWSRNFFHNSGNCVFMLQKML